MGLLQDIQEKYGEIETTAKETLEQLPKTTVEDVSKSDVVGFIGFLFPTSVGLKKQTSLPLSSFEKGQINQATDMLAGLEQSVYELGNFIGFNKDETLQELKNKATTRYKKYKPEDKAMASMGEFVFEAASAAPLATLRWFNSGNKFVQIFKQGGFGFVWDYVFTPEAEGEKTKGEAGKEAAFYSAAAQTLFGVGGKIIEKVTNFDFKDNIESVRDAAKSYNIEPEVLGDFTKQDARKAAETADAMRGGGIVKNIKNNLNKLKNAAGTLADPFTKGAARVNSVGKFTLQRIKQIHDGHKKTANELYKGVDNRVKALIRKNPDANIVDVSNTNAVVEDLIKNDKDLLVKISSSLNRPDLVSKLRTLKGKFDEQTVIQRQGVIIDETGNPLLPEVTEFRKITFPEMRRLREQVGSAFQESIKAGFGSDATRKLAALSKAIDQDMDVWAESFVDNKALKKSYDNAKKYYSENVIPFRDADLAVALIKDPSSKELLEDASTFIQRLIAPAKESQEGAVRAIKLIAPLLDNDTKKIISKKVFDDAFKTAQKEEGFDPNVFINYIKDRKTNLQPFLVGDVNIDQMINKYNLLSKAMTRGKENTIMGTGDPVGSELVQKVAPVTASVVEKVGSLNKLNEFITRQAFNTKIGRELLLSATSIQNLSPLVTAATLGYIDESSVPPEPQRINLESINLDQLIRLDPPQKNNQTQPSSNNTDKPNLDELIRLQ
tara:strand:+ start:1475 stop:3640 length:2166 start_codon:yes stop_codon:yes gene_type:complete